MTPDFIQEVAFQLELDGVAHALAGVGLKADDENGSDDGWTFTGAGVSVFVAHHDVARRHGEDTPRFSVVSVDEDGYPTEDVILESESLVDVIVLIKTRA